MVIGAVILTAGPSVTGGRAEAAEGPGYFVAKAVANAIDISYAVPFTAVERPVEGVGPISQAGVDGGAGVSFASLPYPGDTATNFGSLITAATGQQSPGEYPFYTRAEYPSRPKSEVRDPTGSYFLVADADARAANAEAGSGGLDRGPRLWTQASTQVADDGRTIVATAESLIRALSFQNEALKVTAYSRGVTEYRATDKRRTTESVMAGELLAGGGTKLTFGPKGVFLNNEQHADGKNGAEAFDALNSALKDTGLSVHLFTHEEPAGGQGSSVLEIRDAHSAAAVGGPSGVLTIRLGSVSTSVQVPEEPSESEPDVASGNSGKEAVGREAVVAGPSEATPRGAGAWAPSDRPQQVLPWGAACATRQFKRTAPIHAQAWTGELCSRACGAETRTNLS